MEAYGILKKKKEFVKKIQILVKTLSELARNVYFNNDKRAKIKSDINKLLGSNIKEVKSY